jgi:hypothetical protein
MTDSSYLDGLYAALRLSVADETFFSTSASGCFVAATARLVLACISPTYFPTDPFLPFILDFAAMVVSLLD